MKIDSGDAVPQDGRQFRDALFDDADTLWAGAGYMASEMSLSGFLSRDTVDACALLLRFAKVHDSDDAPVVVRWLLTVGSTIALGVAAKEAILAAENNRGPACGAGGLGVQTPQVGSGEPTAATSSAHPVVGKGGAE